MKKKIVVLMVSIIILNIVGVYAFNIFAKRKIYNKNVYEYGKGYAEKNLDDTEIYSNGIISKKEIEKRVKNIDENLDGKYHKSVQEISEDEASKQALYLYACDKNYSVSDEELDAIVNDIQKEIEGTEEEKLIDDFINGSGMTQEEYWDLVKEKYRITETINKCLKDYEKEQIDKKHIDVQDENYNEELIKIDEELKKKAEKEYRIKIK